MLFNIRVVLVNTSHPGNIGATARAMKTMGLTRLYLVNPALFPDAKATEMAASAEDVLLQAVRVETLAQAIKDCQLVIGSSARSREVQLPVLSPRQCGELAVVEAETCQVAIVFGCERYGLTNEELLQCHYQVNIPSDEVYRSLNLAAAVQIIAYEIACARQEKRAALATEKEHERDEPASSEAIEGFYQHLTTVLIAIGFYNPQNPKQLIPRLRRLFNRVRLESLEVRMLRGILTAVQKPRNKNQRQTLPAAMSNEFHSVENAKQIYLDYMATTPVDPLVKTAMLPYLEHQEGFGNAASTHRYGLSALAAIDMARMHVAALINAQANEIIWTSGATEADNLAIFGAARFYQRKGKHIITLQTEHKAVLDSCCQLEREGFDVTYLSPKQNGLLDIEQLIAAVRPDTILLSVMHVNNEIGVIQDIKAIAELTRQKGIIFHVDAAQSAGKVMIDVENMAVDLVSFSAHKIYGPKGIGALYVRRKPRVRLMPLIFGGGHEQGLRSGTLATHQIVGMGEAFRLAKERFEQDQQHVAELAARFFEGIHNIPDIYLNGDKMQRYCGNISLSVGGVEGESLILALRPLALSTASACIAASVEPSYVIKALGVADELAHSTIRISFGRFTTIEEIDFAVAILQQQIQRLREMSPL